MGVAVITSTSRRSALGLQLHALMHAEAVLLVHHRQAQIRERDVLRKQRMGADQDVDLARRQLGQGLVRGLRLFRARSGRPAARRPPRHRAPATPDAGAPEFGRRHQRRLQAGFHRAQHGQQRHDGLAGADIALQQPQHALRRCHVLFDFGQRLQLRIGQGEGQGGDGLGLQLAGAGDRRGPCRRAGGADQQQRQLVGQQLVIGQPLARRRRGRQIAVMRRRMCAVSARRAKPSQPRCFRKAGVLPFRHRRALFPARRAPPWPWAAASGLRSGHRPVRAAAIVAISSGATT